MSSTPFSGGFGQTAYDVVTAINAAYALVGSSNSVQGPCAFADGLDTNQIDSITVTDGGQYVGLPTGGNASSTNLVISGTKTDGTIGYANLADAKAALDAGGIGAVQALINSWAHANPVPISGPGGFTEVSNG